MIVGVELNQEHNYLMEFSFNGETRFLVCLGKST